MKFTLGSESHSRRETARKSVFLRRHDNKIFERFHFPSEVFEFQPSFLSCRVFDCKELHPRKIQDDNPLRIPCRTFRPKPLFRSVDDVKSNARVSIHRPSDIDLPESGACLNRNFSEKEEVSRLLDWELEREESGK